MICPNCGSHKSICTYDGEWCAVCGTQYGGALITYYKPSHSDLSEYHDIEELRKYSAKGGKATAQTRRVDNNSYVK